MNLKRKLLHLISALLLVQFNQAQNDSLILLDPAVITATLTAANQSNTGRNILVVKGEQVANLPVNSIDELMRYLPGIEMQSRGPMGTQSDISIRGATFQQVLVMLDGIRLNDPLTGHFNAYFPIAPGEIDRIEILKGASSAIYGSEAVGGVVHIITKTFANSQTNSDADIQLTYGDYNLRNGLASGRIVKAKNTFSLGIMANHSDGHPQRGTYGFFNIRTFTAAFAHRFDSFSTLSIRSTYDSRDFSAQNFYTTLLSDTAVERVETWWNHAQFAYRKGKLEWVSDAGYKTLNDNFRLNSTVGANENNTKLLQFQSRINYRFSAKSTLTSGVQFFNRSIASNDRGSHAESQLAVFAVLHFLAAKNLHLDPAIRVDHNERSGLNVLPQLNISYNPGNYQIRGSLSSSMRDADFTERFNNYNREFVRSGRIGNPWLVAEKGINYELGTDFWTKSGFKISGTAFARNQNNLIDWVATPYTQMPRRENLDSTGSFLLADNIWAVNTLGFECDLQYVKRFSEAGNITAQAGVLWVENNTREAVPGIYLAAQSRWLINGNLLLQLGAFEFSLTSLYKIRDPREAPNLNASLSDSYWVNNLKLAYNLPQNLAIFIQADNMGDIAYSDILGTIMPGRWVMGGLRWRYP